MSPRTPNAGALHRGGPLFVNMFWFYDIKYYPLSRHCTQYLPQLEFPLWWAGALAKTCFINKRTQTFIKNLTLKDTRPSPQYPEYPTVVIIEAVCMMSVKQGPGASVDLYTYPPTTAATPASLPQRRYPIATTPSPLPQRRYPLHPSPKSA